MAYDRERHVTTAQRCPEFLEMPDRWGLTRCMELEHHPEPHWAEVPDRRTRLEGAMVRVEWYLPPDD